MPGLIIPRQKKFLTAVLYQLFYEGKYRSRFAADMQLPVNFIDQCNEECKLDARQWIEDYNKKIEKTVKGMKRVMKKETTPETLMVIALERMENAIRSETDPSKIARTLQILDSYVKDNKGNVTKRTRKSAYDELSDKIKDDGEDSQL